MLVKVELLALRREIVAMLGRAWDSRAGSKSLIRLGGCWPSLGFGRSADRSVMR